MQILAFKTNEYGERVEVFKDADNAYIVSLVAQNGKCIKAVTNSFDMAKRLYQWAAFNPTMKLGEGAIGEERTSSS